MEDLVPEELPAVSPELVLLCAVCAVMMAELPRKRRERAMRRIATMLEPATATVIRIRARSEDRAVARAGRQAAAYWKAIVPKLEKLIRLMD